MRRVVSRDYTSRVLLLCKQESFRGGGKLAIKNISGCRTRTERAHSGIAGWHTHTRTTLGKLPSSVSEGGTEP